MFKKKRLTVLSIAVLLALLVSAGMPLAAFAQDEAPPPAEPAAGEVAPPADEPVADAPVAEAPVEDAPVVDAPPAAEELSIPEVLEQLPEETELIVLDESGDALPLASQEAAEVVAAADPFFWDGTQYVGFSTTGVCAAQVTGACTKTATPLQAAIDAFEITPTATGSIYVAAGTYAAGVTIDGSTGNLKNLTGLIGEGSGLTTLTGDVLLLNLNIGANVFTFQGFTLVNGGFWAAGNTATLNITDVQQSNNSNVGIGISAHTGNVNLTKVSAKKNHDGIYVDITGNATIVDSELAENSDAGIYVRHGTVTLNDVYVHDNGTGIFLEGGTAGACLASIAFANNGIPVNGVLEISDAACSACGQGRVSFPDAPVVNPPGGAMNDEGQNIFAPVYEQIVAVKTAYSADKLPGALPVGKTFAAGASIALVLGGEELESAPEAVQVTFEIPAGMSAPFTVLMWNGSAWVEVPSEVVNGMVVFSVTTPGVYALVAQ